MKLVLLLLSLVGFSESLSTGAGGCAGGMAAVGGLHLAGTLTTGTLADAGLEVTVGGVALDPSMPAEIVAMSDNALVVSGATFRGALVRLAGPTDVMLMDALTPVTDLQMAGVCSDPVVGITHMDASDKTSVAGELHVHDPVDGLTLDVTVVVSNSGGVSEYYYTGYTINAVAPPPSTTEAPSPSPVEAPTSAGSVFVASWGVGLVVFALATIL